MPGLLAAGLLQGTAHPLRLGRPEEIPFLARQTRLTFARCGIVDPLSLGDYRAYGGFAGLARARALGPAAIVEEVTAHPACAAAAAPAFPTGIKWKTIADARATANTSSATPTRAIHGTYADRMLMEGDPFVPDRRHGDRRPRRRREKGYVYTRSEYPHAIATFDARWPSRARG